MPGLKTLAFWRACRAAQGALAQRGVATLTVVMVLFFVMAMVSAYANRNLIFEQRVSSNNYRATTALAAAEAGIDWGIAMLNGGRITSSCTYPPAGAGDLSFRDRYLQLQVDGGYLVNKWGVPLPVNEYRPSCVMTTAGWSCNCPAGSHTSLPNLTTEAPVFRVRMLPGDGAVAAPVGVRGLVTIQSRGCSNIGNDTSAAGFPDVSTACHRSFGLTLPDVDGFADLEVRVGLLRAMPLPPVAALTVGNTLTMAGANELKVSNVDPSTGVTVHAGSAINAANVMVMGPPGSTADTRVGTDAVLLAQSVASQQVPLPDPTVTANLFQSLFGMDAATFSRQPAAVFVDCAGGCTSASITTLLANNPGRLFWVNGNIDLDTATAGVPLGTPTQPLMLIASGDITLSANVVVNGFLYGRDITWQAGAGGSVVRGAVVASRNFQGNGAVAVAYDSTLLQRISLSYGSFVRVPGSWRPTGTK